MLRISDFAQIAQISTSALRYYDEIGIFKPIYVDKNTGYRYYKIEQMLELNRILALRDLGIDLSHIVQLLKDDLSAEAFHGMLRLRQSQLEASIKASEEQLARIEARLQQIEKGKNTLVPELVLKTVKATRAAAVMSGRWGFLPNKEFADEFRQSLSGKRVKLDGYTHFIYHRQETGDSDFAIELAIPIEAKQAIEEDAFRVIELPEVSKMASVIHRGNPYSIVEAYQALGQWLEEQSYTIVGACRKIALRWEGSYEHYLTEIQFPVEVQEHPIG